MSRRRPSGKIVVDANIVLSALRGRRTLHYLESSAVRRVVCTTEHVRLEVFAVLDQIDPGPRARRAADDLFGKLFAASPEQYLELMPAAASRLARAPASGNGSPRDAHILALAWTLEADIWSHDRDYAGTGWPSWSSANLIAALADETAAES
ncbi:MAG: PIN domain-containing protein [Methylobacteriaceae bacterium]|nr:PIN domain-containing protein [Methylobacteriaceae bacterium]